MALGSGAVIAGKSLPENWSRPVVDSVMLPAHAQTSGGPFAGPGAIMLPSLGSDSTFAQVVDELVPEAHAIDVPTNPYVCVTPNAALDSASVKLYVDFPDTVLYEFSNVPLNGSSCAYTRSDQCGITDAGDWFENLGLINNAHADVTICCFLDSVTGVGAGRVEFSFGTTVDFSVGAGTCSPAFNCKPI